MVEQASLDITKSNAWFSNRKSMNVLQNFTEDI